MAVHSPFLASLTPEQRRDLEDRLWERQSHYCFIDEDEIDLELHRLSLEIDHIIPLADDGSDAENNFALVHKVCNRTKSASDLEVARVLARFARIEKQANREHEQNGEIDRGANLGHVLRAHKGTQHNLRILVEDSTVRFSIPTDGAMPVVKLPLYTDALSGMKYCFAFLPISYLHHDSRINPRPIGVNLRGLVEEFHRKRPQLHVALAWWGPDSGDEGPVQVFDGQHKAAAQMLLGVKTLPVRLFIRPDVDVLLKTNTNAGDKLKQVAFDSAVKHHLGNTLFNERIVDYQRLRQLPADNLSFSEKDMMKLFQGEQRDIKRYILDNMYDRITRDPGNKLMQCVDWAGKGADKPLSYSTVEKTFYTEFLCPEPLDVPLGSGIDTGTHPRLLEQRQMVRLMSLFSDIFFTGQWNPDLGGRKLEDRVNKGDVIPPSHLRAWRIAREEILVNVLAWVRHAIENYYAAIAQMIEKDRLMQLQFPDTLWTTIENVLRNVGDLPCWVDTKLAQTIFGFKPNRDFWKQIFKTGMSPNNVRVLVKGLELSELMIPRPKGAA